MKQLNPLGEALVLLFVPLALPVAVYAAGILAVVVASFVRKA